MEEPEGKGTVSAETLAELKKKANSEPIALLLGLRMLELTPGRATASIELKEPFDNFHGITHGGIIMTLADFAFGSACNSLAFPSVAAQFNMSFIAAASKGDTLTADAVMLHSGKRAGICEIAVTNQNGRLIAKATSISIPVSRK